MSQTNQQGCAYTYTVKRGDSFYLIARRLGVPLRDLMNANPNLEPTRLMVGDVLCVPHCTGSDAQSRKLRRIPRPKRRPTPIRRSRPLLRRRPKRRRPMMGIIPAAIP